MKRSVTPRQAWRSLRLTVVSLIGMAPAYGGSTGPASLAVQIDATGHAQVSVIAAAVLPKPELLETAVRDSIGLKLEDADLDVEEFKKVVAFSAQSAGAFPCTLSRVNGQIDLKPLADLLRRGGAQTLSVRIIHPRCLESRCAPARLTFSHPAVEYNYSAVLGPTPLPQLQFEFGYSSTELFQILSPLVLVWLIPVSSTLVRRRRLAGIGAFAGAAGRSRRFLFGLGLLAWIVWGAAVYTLRGDELSWFLFGCDSVWTQTAVVVGTFVVPPALAMSLSYALAVKGVRSTASGSSDAGRAWWEGLFASIGSQVRFMVPAIFAGVGVAALRDGINRKADEWLAVAGVSVMISLGTGWWARMGGTGMKGARPAVGEVFQRETGARNWWLVVAVMVLAPAWVVGLAKQWRLDDTLRIGMYAVGLVATIVSARALQWFLRRRYDSQIAQRTDAAGQGASPCRQGATGWLGRIGQPIVTGAIAFAACELFDFPFELTRGDEGWGLLLMSFLAAVLQTLPEWLRRGGTKPSACSSAPPNSG